MRIQTTRRLAAVMCVVIALGVATAEARAAADGASLVSMSFDGRQADARSSSPSVDGSGKQVFFVSRATNLVPGDTNRVQDVFLRHRSVPTTVRISVPAGGGQANGASSSPSASDNGMRVAFSSRATNLAPGDTNAAEDVFVRDRNAGITFRVSLTSGGAQASRASGEPSISENGNRVAFTSDARLSSSDANSVADVYVRDIAARTTMLVSIPCCGDARFGTPSHAPAISGDGRYVAFVNDSIDGSTSEVIVRDLAEARTLEVSRQKGTARVGGRNVDPAISRDGAFVAWTSNASASDPSQPGTGSHVWFRQMRDLTEVRPGPWTTFFARTEMIRTPDGRQPSIIAESGYPFDMVIVYAGRASSRTHVFSHAWDGTNEGWAALRTGRITFDANGGEPNGDSTEPVLAPSGDVVFASTASDLAVDENGVADIFASRWEPR